jgi:hypothetical protein
MLRRTIPAFALLCLAGCAGLGASSPPPPSPAGLGLPLGSDPVFAAVLNAGSALADPPARIGGNAAFAARIIGQLEYVTAMMVEPRFTSIAPIVQPGLDIGRAEARAAVGIAPAAPPASVIGALAATAAALDRADSAGAASALAPIAPDPAATLARLGALPPLPRANEALSRTRIFWGRVIGFDED